jgi:hypothetical protein
MGFSLMINTLGPLTTLLPANRAVYIALVELLLSPEEFIPGL